MTDSLNAELQSFDSNYFEEFDFSKIESKWQHEYLGQDFSNSPLTKTQLRIFAYDYYLKFLPFFRDQKEGCITTLVTIDVSRRLKSKLGLAYLFEKKIILNLEYFERDPALLPYTLFHEMVHLWLYSCYLDPGHNQRFYDKMCEFEATGLPIDPEMHIHTRIAPESKNVYCCPNCGNRWYLKEIVNYSIYCGQCYDKEGIEFFAELHVPNNIKLKKET